MIDDDGSDCMATANGILQCLGMLAEEAASLNLSRTMMAIREAVLTCRAEGDVALAGLDPAGPLGQLLH